MTKIIIQGHGVVGQSTELFLKNYNPDLDIVFNDPIKDVHVNQDEWATADYVIVCVNTNLDNDLSLPENSAVNVDAAINKALQSGFVGKVVVRSTMGIEGIGSLVNQLAQNLIVWPEYIREATWQEDGINPKFVLIGGDAAEEFSKLFDAYSGPVIITDPVEAMIAKLSTNAFLAMKVVFANQVERLCVANNADYDIVRQLLENEGRLGSSHWAVPGFDGKRGFGGKCFPKDIKTFETALVKAGQHIDLIRGAIDINTTLRSNEQE
ncbi:Ugd Predicted UDP-glucose 6-dehydrogenase [uncultured Caudovirales phage]|uniref:Ugd Predicted UDP-glucose 6-dehydrogenase n=1 Tax=uncultured Caudovirales phage TaxID=2100421 RepID=A0A6J5TBZ5_9CAUD|nr:Ugd Predicted UDP-glucose 6-dehydrogenase [uncultured Caudovirales phage]